MDIDQINHYRIILASRSPRRQKLLRELGLRFEVETRDWEEKYPPHLIGEQIALYIAEKKADSFRKEIRENELVISADTIVWCDNRVLDKPVSEDDALEILRAISGKTHEVITGVCLLSAKNKRSFYSSTKVTFTELSDEELIFYIRKFRPYDKAGAYGIQEWIGLAACSKIEGSYFNVMGLPVHQVYKELVEFICKDKRQK